MNFLEDIAGIRELIRRVITWVGYLLEGIVQIGRVGSHRGKTVLSRGINSTCQKDSTSSQVQGPGRILTYLTWYELTVGPWCQAKSLQRVCKEDIR